MIEMWPALGGGPSTPRSPAAHLILCKAIENPHEKTLKRTATHRGGFPGLLHNLSAIQELRCSL
jgi:hypothetical protein